MPAGTVTFLFTDIEGSTQLLQLLGKEYVTALDAQRALLRAAFVKWNGVEVDTQGDSFFVAFARASDALQASVDAQCALAGHIFPQGAALRVRMGLHTGEPQISADHYVGVDVHRAARIAAAAHGGQVLLSQTTFDLVENDLTADVTLRDLGEHRLKDLRRPHRLYQLVINGLPAEFPPIRSLDALPNNLPVPLTSFIGREKEIREIGEMLTADSSKNDLGRRITDDPMRVRREPVPRNQGAFLPRLVTFTGVGGTGKTRLALQVAAEAVDDFHDGVWLVELATITDAELVPQTVATTLGLREQPGRAFLDTLKDYLAKKNLLLVLDNCEHLIDVCAQVADTLLHAAPHLKILATSREALGIAGESTYPVRSLAIPDIQHQLPETLAEYDGVRLFLERAGAVQPNFQLTSQNAHAVAQICARLDGIPLAIELAAARVKGLSVEQIASRLDDRFRLLTGGSRTALPRQRTLQAAIDWSYKLLSEDERVLLRRLAVFAGGWTLEAAEFVCSDGEGTEGDIHAEPVLKNSESTVRGGEGILDALLRLVTKSLVVAETDRTASRYHMLETIRQYAQEKLDESGEAQRLRDRHLEFFAVLARQAEPKFDGSEQLLWVERLETEHENVRAALTWAQGGGSVTAGLQLASDLRRFWIHYAFLREGREYLERLLAMPAKHEAADEIQVRANGLLVAGTLAGFLGDAESARVSLDQSMALWRKLGEPGKQGFARARFFRVFHDWDAIGLDVLPQLFEDVLHLFEECGDRWGMATAYHSLGLIARTQGDLVGARRAFEAALMLFGAIGDQMRASSMVYCLGTVAIREGKYAEARTQIEETLRYYRLARFRFDMDSPLWMLGVLAMREGKYAEAKARYTECLKVDQELGTTNLLPECLIGFAGIAETESHLSRAARLLAAAKGRIETRGGYLEEMDRQEQERLENLLCARLGRETFEQAWAEGRALTTEQAIELALGNDE